MRDCLGGDRIVEVIFPRGVTEHDLERLQGVKSRQILHQLPRPFFRLDVPGSFLVSGILSERRVRFTVRLSVRDRAVDIVHRAAIQLMQSS